MNNKSIKSDLARIDRMKDSDIDYSDIPPLDKTFLKKATATWPPSKKQSTIRLGNRGQTDLSLVSVSQHKGAVQTVPKFPNFSGNFFWHRYHRQGYPASRNPE